MTDPKTLPIPIVEVDAPNAGKEKWRYCSSCGGEAQIVSNQHGRFGKCRQCKTHWPIAPPKPLSYVQSVPSGRGFTKQTIVSQYTNEVLDDAPARSTHDAIGPKHLRKK